MLRWAIKIITWIFLTVVGHYVWPLFERLGEAAVAEWINHQIAERYGIVSPSQQQVVDFFVSWSIPALAIAVAYMLFRAGMWRQSAVAARSAATSSKKSVSGTSPTVAPTILTPVLSERQVGIPNWPIDKLFYHIRPDLLERTDPDVGNTWDEVANDIRDKFSTSRLKVWGRPAENGLGELLGERPAMRLIDPEYWHSAYFTFAFFDSTAGGKAHTYITQRNLGLLEYTDLQVNRAEAVSIWPRVLKVERDVSLYEAIWRAYYGEWRMPAAAGLAAMADHPPDKLSKLVLETIPQLAFDGVLPIWGRKASYHLLEPIASEFWKDHRLDWFSFLKGKPDVLATKPSPSHGRTEKPLVGLMTSRAAINDAFC